ncbi:MAG: (2Fe-2S)-binding protein [Marmoricola sp.]|nr:(2Fe-2S)-binding protein [Marmoricola sp.]
MIVCHCRVVTDRAVADAVRAGAGSVSSVCRATGAGQDCGSCVFSLKRLVCEHGNALVPAGTGPAAILTEAATRESQSAAS